MEITIEKAMAAYQMANEVEGKSHRTIDWYDKNLGYFFRWLKGTHPETSLLKDVTPTILREFLFELRTSTDMYKDHPFRVMPNRTRAPRTIQAYFTCLSAFFRWCAREDYIDKPPTYNIPRPRVPKFLADPFTEIELMKMFDSVKDMPEAKAARMNAIMMVLLDTGVRMAELLSIEVDDIDWEENRIKIFGKGARERYVYFGKVCKQVFWKYIHLYRPEPAMAVKNVFLVHDGYPMPQRRLAHLLNEVSRLSGVEHVHPHRWRRSAATRFLQNNNGNVATLMKMLGHQDAAMSLHYLRISDDQLANAVREHSNVDSLRLRRNK